MPNIKIKSILFISTFLLFFIFLSAFSSQPATTTAISSTPTPTSIYAIPRLQLPEVDPLPITTPDGPVDQYTLAEWNEETTLLALANIRSDTEFPREQPNAYLTLLEESYLQFPELARDESFLLELATIRDMTAFPGMQPVISDTLSSLPIYTQILEDTLNHGKLQPKNVEEWIYKNMVALNVDTIQTSNLFADGNPVWVFNILKFDGYWQVIFFVTQNEGEIYTVSTFSNGEWEHLQRWNYDLYIQDFNDNGVPEITKDKLVWWHGAENAYSELNIYEWDGEHFVDRLFKSPSIQIFFTDSEEEPDRWNYENQSDGTSLIIGKQKTFTTINCPSYIENFNYRWTGHSFELDQIEVEPLPEGASSECKIKWALTATQNEPQSIQAVSTALDDWPDSLDNEIGPASQDYFRLWLAETYALHGDSETALQMLDELISNPQNPLYTGIPEMAKVYKNSFIKGGPYLACQTLEGWKENKRDHAYELSKSSGLDAMQILSEQWGVSVEKIQSGKSCEFYSNFPTLLQQQTFSSRNQLVSWLYLNQIQWNGLREIDMNQDGLKDWLVITQTDYGRNQLWALIQTEGTITPVLVAYTPGGINTTVNLQTSCNQFFPKDGSVPVQIYRIGSHIVAFQIITQDNYTYPFIHFELGDPSGISPRVRGVELDKKTTTIFFNSYHEQYQWNDQHQRFELLQSTADESISPSLEQMLFEDQNPQAAIDKLKTWFAIINPNTDDPWERSFIDNTLPYRTYLLALGYELKRDEKNAVQNYYNLWQKYPESPFAVIARYKLEKIE